MKLEGGHYDGHNVQSVKMSFASITQIDIRGQDNLSWHPSNILTQWYSVHQQTCVQMLLSPQSFSCSSYRHRLA